MRAGVVATCLAMLFMAVQAGIGAPPSAFASRESVWWSLEPLMWPALFGGAGLGFVALLASVFPPVPVKVAATLCCLASLSTAVGVSCAAGISDHRASGAYALMLVFVGLPGMFAVAVFIASDREDRAKWSDPDTEIPSNSGS